MSKEDPAEQKNFTTVDEENLLLREEEIKRNIQFFLGNINIGLKFQKAAEELIADKKNESRLKFKILQEHQEIISNIDNIEKFITNAEDFDEKSHILEKMKQEAVNLMSSPEDLNKMRKFYINYLEDLLLRNLKLEDKHNFISEFISDLQRSIKISESPLYFFLNKLQNDASMEINELVDSNELIDYIMRNLNLGGKNLEDMKANSTPEQFLEATKHYKNFFLKKYNEEKKQLSTLISQTDRISESAKSQFFTALKEGNLKELLYIREKFPLEYSNQIKLQGNFDEILKENFKKAFLESFNNYKLEEFVRDKIGSKIISQFSKYRDIMGYVDFRGFAEDIGKLKDHHDIFDKALDSIIEVFYKLVSIFGIKGDKMRNSSKEKFYSNMVEATMNVPFLGSSSVDENKQKEKINKSNNRHLK